MAEALVGLVLENLLSLAKGEFGTIYGIKGKAEKLSRTLELMKAVVEDAEEKQVTNRSVKVWLQRLKDAVYVLDDIIDEITIEFHQLNGVSSLINPKNLWFRCKIGRRMEEITRRFHEIDEDKSKLVLRERVGGWPAEVAEERLTGPTIPNLEFYGRKNDKDKILEFLLSKERDSDFLSVYPIVGLGGMGKTTLAQMVYNDDRVSSHFNPKIWICVSENFSIKRILCSIVESVTGERYDALGLDVVERKVRDLLQSKRYLLILDDVWKENQEMKFGLSESKWINLKAVLSCGSKGASILVSTRDMDVATIMATGTFPAHYLQGLSEDDCWLLLKQHAFGANKEERAELVAIGKKIAKKCGGSPLAARALGGLLHLKDEENEWLEVMESRLWNLQDERCILPALRLSYFNLTPISRQCFAFCAIFPKDTVINKEDLIYLWMANGFISSTENREVEDVGNTIWKELCCKSFFEEIRINDVGKSSFKMHDLVHDLAESVMGQECAILKNANTSLQASAHHVFVDHGMYQPLSLKKGTLGNIESLRTLYELEPVYRQNYACLPTHHTLRVLQTSSSKLSSLESLIHLRYLELFNIQIKTLPNSIYSLRKLEILKLKYLSNLISLTKHLTHLQNLRHLVIVGCYSLSRTCPNIQKLRSLRTLGVYVVNTEEGHALAELQDLKLGGDMHIKGLENVGSLFDAQLANLKVKSDLHELCLSWSYNEETKSCATKSDQVIEGLQPHSNLKKLRIQNYPGLKSPSWIVMLSSLVDLELYDCSKCVQLPSLGKLPSLRKLKLYNVNIQYLDDDESYDGVEVIAFPSLDELMLTSLSNLERLLKVERGEMFPRLRILEVSGCRKLELPCIPSLTSLTLKWHTNEQLRLVSGSTALTSLVLCYYNEEVLASFPVGTLTCLRTLKLVSMHIMKYLPDELFNNLNALEYLTINKCGELESLPEQGWEGLRSLRTLQFYDCGRLRSLPDGVRHLTSLERLSIRGCPLLRDRCKEGTGEDWDKIAHVPIVEIH